MIRVGIVGGNFGRMVLVPAFRRDPRCEVVAVAGSNAERAQAFAREAGVAQGFGAWADLIDAVDAVAVAVPPALQPEIAGEALARGKAILVEKPLAADLAGARALMRAALASDAPALIDFEFTELPSWQRAKQLLDAGAIGALRQVTVTWQVENAATRLRLKHWKTSRAAGGGTLGNLASHSLHYLEWFCGPIAGLSARLFGLPGEDIPSESSAVLTFAFANGAGGSLAVSAAAFLGSGHRLEFYGEEGSLVLANVTPDYMRGFTLTHARRPGGTLETVPVADSFGDLPDPRIAPVSRLAAKLLDAVETGAPVAGPTLADGFRVQALIAAARHAHDTGRWLAADAASLEALS